MKELIERIKETYGDIAKVVNNTIMLFNNTKVLVIDKEGNNYSWYVRYQNKFLTNNNLSSLEQMINIIIKIFLD